jgi:aerobic-type carbon monoxide dehydrogenase small subunit (CoxS/CutS family)
MEKYTITVNGVPRTVEAEPDEKLLDILREKLHLTGAKRGCDDLSCGACTVVVNGKAEKSCMYPMKKAAGAKILTVEGLSKGMELHPIQRALIDAGAVQCGYCTPGIIMELYALLTVRLDPSDEELTTALDRHLCRCTGYEAIAEGARLAIEYMKKS